MKRTSLVVLDDGQVRWAESVVGQLLGRPGLDVTVLAMRPGELSAGSTGRLMWTGLPKPRLLVARTGVDQVRQWFAAEGLDDDLAVASEATASTAVSVLGGMDGGTAMAAVLDWNRRVCSDALDDLVDRLNDVW